MSFLKNFLLLFQKILSHQNSVFRGIQRVVEASHKAFTEKYGLPFQLLADIKGAITKAYDVEGSGYSKRVTYIIDAEGKISHVDEKVKTDSHAKDILEVIGTK